MSIADKNFITTCTEILEHGTDDFNQIVRPHWEDGTPAHTYNVFGIVNRYNLQEEFPAVTLRKTALKSAMDEILWIYQKKSNNVHDLNSHVWDQWADADGFIGKAYGYQAGKKYSYKEITEDGLRVTFPDVQFVRIPYVSRNGTETLCTVAKDGARVIGAKGQGRWEMDQVDKVIYDLKNNSFSRRIMTTLWNPDDLAEMALEPCAYSMTYRVTEKYGKKYLNAVLNQRSNDMLAAGAWNVAQYAILVMMFAQVCDMEPGELVHVIADAHIYDRHEPLIRELIKRKPKPAPKVWLNPNVKDFYQFTTNDLHVEDYEVAGEQMKFEVAV